MFLMTLLLGGFYVYVTWNGDIDLDREIDDALQKELGL